MTAEPIRFFENAMLRVQYPREYPASSCLNHCDRLSRYCASLAEEESESESEDRRMWPICYLPVCYLSDTI